MLPPICPLSVRASLRACTVSLAALVSLTLGARAQPVPPENVWGLDTSAATVTFSPEEQYVAPNRAAGAEAVGSGGLAFFTRLAGPGTENAWDIAVDAAGNAYIAGMSDSPGRLAGSPSAHRLSAGGGFDAVVIKLNPDGAIVYVAWIGGSALDQASKIAVDAAGSAYIAGYTFSSDFPTTAGAYDETFNGGDIDAFVAKLSPDGSRLEYATFLGGSADDYGGGIAVDQAGQAVVTGYTESSDFPTTPGAFDQTYNGLSDVIAVRLNAAGSALSYSSFIGSPGVEIGYDVALGPVGDVYLTGQATSQGFPTTPGSVGPVFHGGLADAFVLKLSSVTGTLSYSTYLGGTEFDDAKGIAVDAQGNAFVAGRTESLDFPATGGAYDTSYNGGRDAFVTALNKSATAYVYSTYVGGGGEEESGGVVLGPAGAAFVTGWTFSSDFPTTPGAFDQTYNGDYDAFVFALGSAGSRLDYGTFLGNRSTNYGRGIGTDGGATAYVTGYSSAGNVNAFGLKLNLPLASGRFTEEGAAAGAYPAAVEASPPALSLGPARPNPLSSRAALRFALPVPSRVRLAVYDELGREVAVLLDGGVAAGPHDVALDASRLPAGVYVVRLEAEGRVVTRAVTVVE